MEGQPPELASTPTGAVFLSYASQDAEAAQKICDALSAAGIEVWFDKSELRGGDAWDRRIREQIHSCRLFIPVISVNTEARDEGYFRREWGFAADRTRDIAEKRAFLVPVVIDDTPERDASVPDKFHQIQWTRLPRGETPPAFVARVAALLGPATPATTAKPGPAPATIPKSQKRKSRASVIVLVILGLAIAIGGGWLVWRHGGTRSSAMQGANSGLPAGVTEKSIAVLPFVDMSEKHDQEYFGDGMAEEILGLLATIPQLTVIGRTSSFQFKERNEDLRAIGEKLHAAYVVEGSVRKSAARIRVTAQLIDTRSGSHIWSNSYDRDFGDVLSLQHEIATSITRALQVAVGADDLRPRGALNSPEAYTLYLRGRSIYDAFSSYATLPEAETYFEQALALDPTFVRAAEALAWVYAENTLNQGIAAREGWRLAREAAERALRLDVNASSPHAVLGLIHAEYDFDWAGADREFDKALALNPRDSVALDFAARIASHRAMTVLALQRVNASLVLDPLNPFAHNTKCLISYFSGDLATAEQACRKVLEISPTFWGGPLTLGLVYLAQGKLDAAMKEVEAEPTQAGRYMGLAIVYHILGRKVESDAMLARIFDPDPDWPMGTALAHAYRGEREETFRWLEKAYTVRDPDLPLNIVGSPALASLRGDPRYAALLRKMNLPD
jgi:TolB-like protein